jgi:hypothetical protein
MLSVVAFEFICAGVTAWSRCQSAASNPSRLRAGCCGAVAVEMSQIGVLAGARFDPYVEVRLGSTRQSRWRVKEWHDSFGR